MVRSPASESVNMYLILWGQAQMQVKESEFWGRGCKLIKYLKITVEEVWALEERMEFRERELYSNRLCSWFFLPLETLGFAWVCMCFCMHRELLCFFVAF